MLNQNLEAMAKQLYDYWFVQFDFPNEEGKPYKSSGGAMIWDNTLHKLIPENWNHVQLAELLSTDKLLQINPALQPDVLFKHLSFPSYDKCNSYEEKYGSDIHSNKTVVKENYVLAAKLNPWIKRIAWGTDDENLICSTEFVVLNPKKREYKAFIFEMANQDSFIDYCTSSTTGTSHSQRRVKPEIMKQFQLPFSEPVCIKLSKIIEPLLLKQMSNISDIRILQHQRDELLPLLMNGQVTVRQLNSDLVLPFPLFILFCI